MFPHEGGEGGGEGGKCLFEQLNECLAEVLYLVERAREHTCEDNSSVYNLEGPSYTFSTKIIELHLIH